MKRFHVHVHVADLARAIRAASPSCTSPARRARANFALELSAFSNHTACGVPELSA